jgi:hypothetical protein
MRTILKYAAAVALTGALAVAAATPSQARHGRNAAAGIGFVAGALLGSAIVNNGYYGEPGYYDQGSYGYGAGSYEPYAYEPAPGYYAPAPRYYGGSPYHRGTSTCGASPASSNFGVCN